MSDEYAFPNAGNDSWGMAPEYGMTMRDYFAGQAISAALQRSYDHGLGVAKGEQHVKKAAAHAYEIADAMLAERQKGGEA